MTKSAVKLRVVGKPFEKGVDSRRNTAGRATKPNCVTSCLAELLQGDPSKVKAKWVKQGQTGAMMVALALFVKMGHGDTSAIHEGLDRVQGKVTDKVEHSGAVTIERIEVIRPCQK
jgi:hypothetical protein